MSPIPPTLRSPQGAKLDQQATPGELTLQCCATCQSVQYPSREVCGKCLGAQLDWTVLSGAGQLLARSELQHSLEPYFLDQLPWTLASVLLDCGPVVLAWLSDDCPSATTRVEVSHYRQAGGSSILRALPAPVLTGPEELL